jgi:hypothetical protein
MESNDKLTLIQCRKQYYYEAYHRGEMDQKEYLSKIYPLDIMIERIELCILLQHISVSRNKK